MIPYKNGIWFYPGHRRLQLVPWIYKIPDFEFISGKKMEKPKSVTQIIHKPQVQAKPVQRQKPAPLKTNQSQLF